MTDAAAGKTIPLEKVSFFFLLLFMVSSFADLRFSVGGKGFFTFSNFEFFGYLLLAALLASACMESFAAGPKEALLGKPGRWLLLYFLWGGMAALFARGAVAKSILIDLKEMIPGMVGYFGVLLLLQGRGKLRLLLGCWLGAGMVNVILAFSQFFLGGPHPVQPGENAMDKLDLGGEVASKLVNGFFSHPNLFSQVIIPYCVVFASAWVISRKRAAVRPVGYLLVGGIFGAVLLMTLAKGAMLWSVLGVALVFAMDRWRWARSPRFFALFWLLGVAAMNSVALLLLFQVISDDALHTIFSRLQFVVTSVNIFLEHPVHALFGGGMRFWEQYVSVLATWEYPNAHNVYLNQMLFYGLVGLSLLVAFVMGHVKLAARTPAATDRPLTSPLPYLGAVFAMSGSYFFEPSFEDPIQKFQLFFALALCLVLSRRGGAMADTGAP